MSKLSLPMCLAFVLLATSEASALVLGPDFAADYTVNNLGSVPDLPPLYGGLTFKLDDPGTILIGGDANTLDGRLYEIEVVRGAENHITGFSGSASPFGDVGEYNDGGVAYGPEDVLFTAQWPENNLGQTKPGSADEDRVDNLDALGIDGISISAAGFVPNGFDSAGRMKIVSWGAGNWYDVQYSPDGSGTFNLDSAMQIDLDPNAPGIQVLPGGPEGFVYVDDSSPGFDVNSLLVSDYSADRVSAYELAPNGDPLVATRRDFLTGLLGAEGAVIDPLTGDFLFSTFGGGDQVIVVEGFAFALGEIGGTTWEDLNGNGVMDAGEGPLGGWEIQLLDEDQSVIATTTTAANGSYSFSDLEPDSYFVRAAIPPECEQTFDATGGNSLLLQVGESLDGVNFGSRCNAYVIEIDSGDNQDVPVGQPLDKFVVKVTNPAGDPVQGVTIVWTEDDGDGILKPAKSVTDSKGLANARLEPGNLYAYSVTARIDSTDETVIFTASLFNVFSKLPGLSPSEQSFGYALDNACAAIAAIPEARRTPGQRDLLTQCGTLMRASLGQAVEAIVELAPDFLGIVRKMNIAFASTQLNNLLARVHELREGGRGMSAHGLTLNFGNQSVNGNTIAAMLDSITNAGGGASADEAGFERLGFFINGTASFGDKDETSREAGFDFSTQGLTAGVDYRFMKGLVLGAAIGYGNSDVDLDRDAGGIDADGWTLSTYGTYYATDQFYLEGSLSYGWDSYDQARNIRYSLLDGTRHAKSDFDGNLYSVLFGGGYDFFKGPGILDVYGRLRYIHAEVDGYREQGAQGWDLLIEDQDATSFKSVLGVQYSHAISTARAVLLPQAWIEWAHEFETGDDDVNGYLANDPTRTLFALATDSFDTDTFRLGLGLGAQFAEGRTAFVSYEAALGVHNYTQHSFSLGLRVSF